MYSGLSGSSIHLKDFSSMFGLASGTACDGVSQPALPNEHPCPMRSRSSTVTDAPRRASSTAQATPTMPPPTMATSVEAGRVVEESASLGVVTSRTQPVIMFRKRLAAKRHCKVCLTQCQAYETYC